MQTRNEKTMIILSFIILIGMVILISQLLKYQTPIANPRVIEPDQTLGKELVFPEGWKPAFVFKDQNGYTTWLCIEWNAVNNFGTFRYCLPTEK